MALFETNTSETVAEGPSAVLAVKWMVGYLKSHGMEIFGWYRVILAIAVAAWLLWPSS